MVPWAVSAILDVSSCTRPGKHPPYGNTYREAWFRATWPDSNFLFVFCSFSWRFLALRSSNGSRPTTSRRSPKVPAAGDPIDTPSTTGRFLALGRIVPDRSLRRGRPIGFRMMWSPRSAWSASSSKSEKWSDLKQFEELFEELLVALISFRPKSKPHVPEVEPFEPQDRCWDTMTPASQYQMIKMHLIQFTPDLGRLVVYCGII